MENKKLIKIKDRLLQEKIEVEKELNHIAKKKGKKFTTIYPEYGSRDEENAAELTEYTLNLALDRNLEKMLSDILSAIDRIEKGSYGKCTMCRKSIPEKRLEVFPAAAMCIECKTKKENPVKKFFGKFSKNQK